MLSATLSEKHAACILPSGEHVEVMNRVPLYALARRLEAMGYGDCLLQAYTPTGTPSLRGKVSVMAGLMVEESDKGGLRLRKYKPFSVGGRVTQRDLGSEGTHPPENEEAPLCESPPDEKAA